METLVLTPRSCARRIRDPHLVMEMTEAGEVSRTDIAICYVQDRVDKELLENVKGRIEALEVQICG